MFVKEITKRYDGKAVVDGVSFEVPKGKVLSLIGPNGAGKSTVMGMLSRLIARDSGLVDFEGTEITRGAIDAVVSPALNAQTFDISDAVVRADFETALYKLQELYVLQTDPIAVLGAIGAQLRRLFYARVILSAGGGQ